MPNLSQLFLKQVAAFDRQPFNKLVFLHVCRRCLSKNNMKKLKVQNCNFSIVFSSIPTRKLHFLGLTLKNSVFGVTSPTQENCCDSTYFLLFGARIFFFSKMPSRSYFPFVVKQFTDIPIYRSLFKEKTETSMNFTVPVFLQYFYFHLLFKCIRKSGFPKKFCQKSIVFYFTERFPKAKVAYLFLFPTNSYATYYQWSTEITNIC